MGRARTGGSVSQPDQELTRIDRTEAGGHPIVGTEVIPETVLLCCLAGGAPGDGPVAGVGAVPEDVGEGGVHRVSVELRVS